MASVVTPPGPWKTALSVASTAMYLAPAIYASIKTGEELNGEVVAYLIARTTASILTWGISDFLIDYGGPALIDAYFKILNTNGFNQIDPTDLAEVMLYEATGFNLVLPDLPNVGDGLNAQERAALEEQIKRGYVEGQ